MPLLETPIDSLTTTPGDSSVEGSGTVSPVTTLAESKNLGVPLFISDNTMEMILDTVLDTPDIVGRTRSCYELPNYDTFKPSYYCCPVLIPKWDKSADGQVVYLKDVETLMKLDDLLEESRTVSRLTVQVCTRKEPHYAHFVHAYIWNGNSRAGEFQDCA